MNGAVSAATEVKNDGRSYNFNAGPGALPIEVLKQVHPVMAVRTL